MNNRYIIECNLISAKEAVDSWKIIHCLVNRLTSQQWFNKYKNAYFWCLCFTCDVTMMIPYKSWKFSFLLNFLHFSVSFLGKTYWPHSSTKVNFAGKCLNDQKRCFFANFSLVVKCSQCFPEQNRGQYAWKYAVFRQNANMTYFWRVL